MSGRDNPYYVRDCKLCGCPLGFGKTNEGKSVPLDLRSPVYCVVYDKPRDITVVRTELCFVTHFCTCTDPGAFSKTKNFSPEGAGV